jgi:hypothetical protein
VDLPTPEQIDAHYKQWFTENYVAPCGKTPPTVIAFVQDVLETFIKPQLEQ